MTTAISLVHRLHQHRAWVNQNLLAAAAQLNDEQLRRPFAIGQGSVWKSLTHMYAAEYVWLAALQGNENALAPGDVPGQLPGNQQGEDALRTLDELRQKWSALEKRWADDLAAHAPESLDELVYRFSASFGERFSCRRSDVLLHVCAHAQYTTAQVVNMLRHLGVEKLPSTMLMALARQEAKQQQP
ncbi:MAG TPA: DinB family protein [Pirellulales bacterium]|nr:DinB family protein [Pirellulales bacterium]